ncbi:hypothetical protein CAEBREN_26047 [Caenorhabditis brenneri]|uniref:DUF7038 domain-containing protein n=1 Tax=Caenorhabditis brenneri TaxID=135651 RepID=G0NV53_CAEBE|nr:hypothetical protein CAEBREN_26047 [Caenorhabditis brenneri]
MLKVIEFILGFKVLDTTSFCTLARTFSLQLQTTSDAHHSGLSQYICMNEGSFITTDKKYNEYMRTTGQIFTWATSPNAEEIAHMTEEIWSPCLGYLTDPDHQFNPKFSLYCILCFVFLNFWKPST